MFNIYDLISSGYTAEEIVDNFTKCMNEAEERIAREEAERRALEEEAERLKNEATAKEQGLVEMLDTAMAWLAHFYPALGIMPDSWDDEDLVAVARLVIAAMDAEVAKMTKPKTHPRKKMVATTDDVFDKFFSTFGLKS